MQSGTPVGSRFQVLSLDGGGLKGLFTAAYLAEWEVHTGRPVVDAMDLIAGTSAGGIIALGLGAGYSAKDLVEFFCEHSEIIFPQERIRGSGLLRQALGNRYSDQPLKAVLETYFGDRRMGDSCVRLIVPAYHAESGIHLFKTSHHPRLRMDWRDRMSMVARATSAAPTFLPPVVLNPGLRLIDGGLVASNPIQIAVTEALGYLRQPLGSVAALRVSTTTEAIRKNRYPMKLRPFGLGTVPLFVEIMMRGQSQAASGGVWQLLGADRFVEINPIVAPKDYRLDQLSEDLIGMAKATFRQTVSELGDKRFLDHRAAPFSPFHTDQKEISHG